MTLSNERTEEFKGIVGKTITDVSCEVFESDGEYEMLIINFSDDTKLVVKSVDNEQYQSWLSILESP